MEKTIQKILDYQVQIDELKPKVTDEYNKYENGSTERMHTLERGEVKESDLWYEVANLGEKSEAGQFLKEKYPTVFELSKQYLDLVEERDAFVQKELQMNPLQLTFGDIIRLIQLIK